MAIALFCLLLTASNLSGHRQGVAATPVLRPEVLGHVNIWTHFSADNGYVPYATLSADHKLLLSSYDEAPRVWDVKTGLDLFTIDVPTKYPPAAFSADDSRLVLADYHHVTVWNVRTGKQICRLHPEENFDMGVVAVAFSRDASKVYCRTEGGDPDIRAFNAASGRRIEAAIPKRTRQALASHEDDAPVLSRDGERELVIYEKVVEVRAVPSGRRICHIQVVSPGELRMTNAYFINNDTEILTTQRGEGARVWDARTGRFLRRFCGPIEEVSPDGLTANKLKVVGPFGSELLGYLNSPPDEMDETGAGGKTVVSPDGKRRARIGLNGDLFVSDAKPDAQANPVVVDGIVDEFAFGRNGRIYVLSASGEISEIDLKTLKPITKRSWSDSELRWLAVGAKGDVYVNYEGTVEILDPDTLAPMLRLSQYVDGSWVVVTPDGKFDSSGGAHPTYGRVVVRPNGRPVAIPLSKLDRFYVPGLASKVFQAHTRK